MFGWKIGRNGRVQFSNRRQLVVDSAAVSLLARKLVTQSAQRIRRGCNVTAVIHGVQHVGGRIGSVGIVLVQPVAVMAKKGSHGKERKISTKDTTAPPTRYWWRDSLGTQRCCWTTATQSCHGATAACSAVASEWNARHDCSRGTKTRPIVFDDTCDWPKLFPPPRVWVPYSPSVRPTKTLERLVIVCWTIAWRQQ